MTPIQVGAAIRGAGRIVEAESIEAGRLRVTCENGAVFWCDPDEDHINDDGWLILESAYVEDQYDEPVPAPWAARERRVA